MSIIAKAVEQLLQQRPPTPVEHSLRERRDGALPEAQQPSRLQPSAHEAKVFEPQEAKTGRRRINLDLDRLRNNGLVIPGETSPAAEEYRLIKRPLLLNAFGPDQVDRGNLLMVTSARPGEGKTFTAVNLALSMLSEQDVT